MTTTTETATVTDELASRMVATIPDCRLVEIPGAGHAVHSEQPAAFLEAVGSFLATS